MSLSASGEHIRLRPARIEVIPRSIEPARERPARQEERAAPARQEQRAAPAQQSVTAPQPTEKPKNSHAVHDLDTVRSLTINIYGANSGSL